MTIDNKPKVDAKITLEMTYLQPTNHNASKGDVENQQEYVLKSSSPSSGSGSDNPLRKRQSNGV